MKTDMLFSSMNVSASGLRAQRKRMNIVAENIANADTTRTKDGTPYQRKFVTFETASQSGSTFASQFPPAEQMSVPLAATTDGIALGAGFSSTSPTPMQLSEVEGDVETDTSPFKMIYDPSHPDADANGYVKSPNVNVVTEMVEMIAASRGYEANVTAITAGKQMAKDALEI
ncbi:MAG TPA: flagellar basal body rod protein FlgC [Bacteroidota bacterium]|nr:flagellar basal body rod protein FlgC [Bacteroidota bacterium]